MRLRRPLPAVQGDTLHIVGVGDNRIGKEPSSSGKHLLTRPVGRPPNHVRRHYAGFSYRAKSWDKARRVVAKVEWHPSELFPRVGFIVTNLSRPAERVTLFYNQRGKAEQCIKEGKNAIKWTRLSCRRFRDNAVRLQLHALAYNLANFMRTLALPKEVEYWSLTTLREKLVKIGAKVVSHGRYVTFQLAEVAVPRELFRKILSLIDDLRPRPAPAWAGDIDGEVKTTGGVCLNGGKTGKMGFQPRADFQNQAIGWLQRGYGSLDGGTGV